MRLDSDVIRAALPVNAVIGGKILVFEETDSTNDLAAKAGDDGLAEGLAIFAELQRAGRGTSGRRWISPPHRNLMFSVLLRPTPAVAVSRWPELTFCAALAVAETAEKFTQRAACIKWPNDVYMDGRKVAGILLESHQRQAPGFVVVGIGLNVLQQAEDFDPAIRATAGSLAMLAAGAAGLDRQQVAASVLEHLGTHYTAWPEAFQGIMAECEQRGCLPPRALAAS